LLEVLEKESAESTKALVLRYVSQFMHQQAPVSRFIAELGRWVQSARVVVRFTCNRYSLACHECQLGRLEHANGWLEKAFKPGDATQLELAAPDDPDLEPLWASIGSV